LTPQRAHAVVSRPALQAGRHVYTEKVLARTPVGQLSGPEDVAQAAVFLTSHAVASINGMTIIVDGGTMAVW
jgi:NAD(P)-dependent dehydrogenase (short-subunit alcohol dehydrogenase family)